MSGRIRTIKPGFFTDEEIARLPPLCRLLFIGLWGQADRTGRLENRPQRLKVELLPYDAVDIDVLLSQLAAARFIVVYEVAGKSYIQVRTFATHQRPNIREPEFAIPPPPEGTVTDPPPIIVVPEDDRPTEVTYVVKGANGTVKIGRSANWESRLRDLRCTVGIELEVVALIAGGRYERVLHQKFDPLRKMGEWFEATDDLVAHVKELATLHPVNGARAPVPTTHDSAARKGREGKGNGMEGKEGALARNPPGLFDRVLGAFKTAWENHYREEYVPTNADRSQLGRLLSTLSGEQAQVLPACFKNYLADVDPFVAQAKRHSLAWFVHEGGINKYRVQAQLLSPKEARGKTAAAQWLGGRNAKN